MPTETPISTGEKRTIGRSARRDLSLDDDSVSRLHATAEVTAEGYLSIVDEQSSNGTWLHRAGRWTRVRKIILGSNDRLRLGKKEIPTADLLALFGLSARVRLREGDEIRPPREVFQKPRRNPLTGNIEEQADSAKGA